jgi:putative transposase
MRDRRRGSHTVFEIQVHVCWVTKYRYRVLVGDVAQRLRELVCQVCERNDVRILRGHVAGDHVHVLVSLPARLSVSKLMQYVKGKTSHALQMEYPHLRKRYWGRHLWARGYYCVSVGNVTEEMIAAYIEGHEEQAHDGGFRIEGEDAPREL